jgi:hypothetical protein
MIGRVSFWMGCGVLLLGLGASTASAQNGNVGLGAFGGGGGYGFGYFNYGSGINNAGDHIPFYALYPPVYYSFPVARPYGYSPFAYPPGVATPDIPPAAAQYRNPFVPQNPDAKPTSDRTAGPRMYLNPFVQQTASAGNVSLANQDGR